MDPVLFAPIPVAFSAPCDTLLQSGGSVGQDNNTVRSAPLYPVEVAPNAASKAVFEISQMVSNMPAYTFPQQEWTGSLSSFPPATQTMNLMVPSADVIPQHMAQSQSNGFLLNQLPAHPFPQPLVGSWIASDDDEAVLPTPQFEQVSPSSSMFTFASRQRYQQSDQAPQPEVSMGASESCFFYRNPSLYVRQRTAQACDKCRDRKTKCSGNRPTCKRCADRGLACVYSNERSSRGSSKAKKRSSVSVEAEDSPSPKSVSTQEEQQQQQQEITEVTPTPVQAPFFESSAKKEIRGRPGPARALSIIVPDRATVSQPQVPQMQMPELSPGAVANLQQWMMQLERNSGLSVPRATREATMSNNSEGPVTPPSATFSLSSGTSDLGYASGFLSDGYDGMSFTDDSPPSSAVSLTFDGDFTQINNVYAKNGGMSQQLLQAYDDELMSEFLNTNAFADNL